MMERKEHRVKGAMLMASACGMFCIMASLVKYIQYVDAYKTSLFRFILGMAILGTAAMTGKVRLDFNNAKLLFLRGLLGGAGIYITFLVYIKLGISKGSILISTTPVFASIFAFFYLKERPGLVAIPAIVGTVFGVYLLSSGGNASLFSNFGIYEILALSCGAIGGLAVVMIRKLHDTDSSFAIFFSQCAVGFWLVLVPANVTGGTVGLKEVAILLLIGLAATAGQLLMTAGYKYLPVRIGATVGMLEPTLNYAAGIIIFGEALSRSSLLGAVLIIGCCLAVLMHKGKPNSTERIADDVAAS